MVKIEVKSSEIFTKSGVSAKSGKPYSIREQECYAHLFAKDGKLAAYPVRVSLTLEDTQQPYQPGQYQLDPRCVYVDRFGGLVLGRIKLLPLASAVPASARQAA